MTDAPNEHEALLARQLACNMVAAERKLPHVHYCKDYADKTGSSCMARGYCECECGARAARSPEAYKWVVPADASEVTT
jgi:hypothetical protein